MTTKFCEDDEGDEEQQRHKVLDPHYRFQLKQKPKVKVKEERKKIETKVAEKLERRAQKSARASRAKKRQEKVMQQRVPNAAIRATGIPTSTRLHLPPSFHPRPCASTNKRHFNFSSPPTSTAVPTASRG